MQEVKLRELIANGLPKIAANSFQAVYSIPFQAAPEAPRECTVDAQAVGSQLLYTRHFQMHALLSMDAGQIFLLGQRAFPKHGRMESPRRVVSANGEALNTIMGKLAYVVGKVDGDSEAVIAPPIVLNCSGANRLAVEGGDWLFVRLSTGELSMRIMASVRRV